MAASSSVDKIGPTVEQSLSSAQAVFKALNLPMTGEMISVYTKFRIKEGVFETISGYIIPEHVPIPAGSGVTAWSL